MRNLLRKISLFFICISVLVIAFAQSNPLENALPNPYPAPQIAGIVAWVNSSPLTNEQLKGKVVLIDFWTYSCINCIRTLPYLKDWYGKYHSKGFEIIGVHTPEFEFEKNLDNVKSAVQKDGILYPVALDSNFVTWQNFKNLYWPAHYLIDQNGNVVYQHFGEGDYDVTENNIRYLLGMNKATTPIMAEEASFPLTPETYLGFAREQNYASPETISKGKPQTYSFPASLSENQWALQGSWIIGPEYIVSAFSQAAIKIKFNAKKVFVVMGSSNGKPIQVRVALNGAPIKDEKGKDVKEGVMTVTQHRLYEAVVLPGTDTGELQLTASDPGLEVYTFTFG